MMADNKKELVIYSLLSLVLFTLSSCAVFIYYKFPIKDETLLFSWAWMNNYFFVKTFFILFGLFSIVAFFFFLDIKKMNYSNNLIWALPIVFIILALALSGVPEINPDSVEYYGVAKYISVNGPFNYIMNFSELRGFRFHTWPFIMGLIYWVLGEYYFISKIFHILMFSLIPILTYYLSKQFYDNKQALISASLMLGFPIIFVQSSMFLVDISTIVFVLLANLMFVKYLQKKGAKYYFFALASIILAMLSKKTAIVYLISSFIPILFYFKFPKKKLINILVPTIVTFLVFILFNLKSVGIQLFTDLFHFFSGSNFIKVSGPMSFFYQINVVLLVFGIISLFMLFRKPRLSSIVFLCWVIFPLIIFYDTTVRYLLPAFPALAIFSSSAISNLKDNKVLFILFLIFISSSLLLLTAYLPYGLNNSYSTNIKQVGLMTNDLGMKNVGVYGFYDNLSVIFSPKTEIYPTLVDYYSSAKISYAISDSVIKTYYPDYSRFDVFAFYIDENYHTPNYDGIIILSNSDNLSSLNERDAKKVLDAMSNYDLVKQFNYGTGGIEPNPYVYLFQLNLSKNSTGALSS